MIEKLFSVVSNKFSEKTLGSHDGTVRKVVISADGKYAGTASGDHTAKIWDLRAKTLVCTLGSTPKNLTGGGIGTGHLHIVTCNCSLQLFHFTTCFNLFLEQP